MIAEAVPDASARVFLAERKATTPPAASAAAGTTVAAAAATSKPPPPPLPVSASFARSNPWTDLSSPLDAKQRLLLLFLGVPLLLWRLLLTATILPCVHVCFWALVAGQDLGAPLSPARARCTSALLRFWSGGLLFLAFGALPRIKNRGEWNRIVMEAKAQRAVIVFNHVSYLDGLAVVSLLQPCCAAKRQVASLPFFGVWSRALQFLFIERGPPPSSSPSSSPAAAADDDAAAAAAAAASASRNEGAAAAMARRAADARFPLLAVSPEGTTKAAHCLLRFKSGAFVSGGAVLPLCLDYRRGGRGAGRGGRGSGGSGKGGRAAAPRPSPALAGALAGLLDLPLDALAAAVSGLSNFNPGWGLLQSDALHVLRAYMSPWTPLSIEALPLMRPRAAAAAAEGGGGAGGAGGEAAAAAAESPADFAERVRRAMSLALDAPCVDLGVEDWARLKAAGVAVDPSGTKVLWRPGGPGTARVEVVAEEEEEEEEKEA